MSSVNEKKPDNDTKWRKLPRNYFNEVFALMLLALIGIIIVLTSGNQQVLLAIGSGIFTGPIVGIISLTTSSLRKRRADLEDLAIIGMRTHSRLMWICRFPIKSHSLDEIYRMLSELDVIVSIQGRLWFVRKKDWEKCYDLYSILSNIKTIEESLIQYRLTTEDSGRCLYLEIIAINKHFKHMLEEDPELPSRLGKLTTWAIDYCNKSRF